MVNNEYSIPRIICMQGPSGLVDDIVFWGVQSLLRWFQEQSWGEGVFQLYRRIATIVITS